MATSPAGSFTGYMDFPDESNPCVTNSSLQEVFRGEEAIPKGLGGVQSSLNGCLAQDAVNIGKAES